MAVVTGGASGIGEAIATRLAEEGDMVAIIDIDLPAAERVLTELKRKKPDIIALRADTSVETEVQASISQVISRWGKVDILVNNAGITKPGAIEDMSEEAWDRVLDVNLKGYFLCTKAVIPIMKSFKYGRIVNISSLAAIGMRAGRVNYVASKAGVIGLTRILAVELGPWGISVNAIAPGFIETPLVKQSLSAESRQKATDEAPMRRAGVPQDIANAVLFLASDEASFITGQCLFVDGGRSINRDIYN